MTVTRTLGADYVHRADLGIANCRACLGGEHEACDGRARYAAGPGQEVLDRGPCRCGCWRLEAKGWPWPTGDGRPG